MLQRFRKWRFMRRFDRTRERAVALAVPMVARLEGFRAQAYQCNAGHWTIGYGARWWPSAGGGPAPVREGEHVQEYEAREMLRRSLKKCVGQAINMMSLPHLELPEPCAAAGVASLIYNVGPDPVEPSRFLANWRRGFVATAKTEFLDFNKATIDGVFRPVEGLTRRREREWLMITEGK